MYIFYSLSILYDSKLSYETLELLELQSKKNFDLGEFCTFVN